MFSKPFVRSFIRLFLAMTPVAGSLESRLLAQTWSPTSAPTNNWTAVACSADGNKLIASAANGAVYLSTNSGSSWQPSSTPATNLIAVCSSADGNALAATSYGSTYGSKNSGLTWQQLNAAGLPSVACSADGTKILTLGGWQLFASADSGTSWKDLSLQVVPVGSAFLSIASSADGNTSLILEYGQGSVFIETHSNLCAGWGTVITEGYLGQGYAGSLAASADGNKLAAFVNGADPSGGTNSIYISTNGGASWTSKVNSAAGFTSIASSADGMRLVAVTTGDISYRSVNSGGDWMLLKAPASNWVSVASSADGGKVVAAVAGGGIYIMQTAPTPVLETTPTTNSILLSWMIPSQNLVLKQSSELSTPSWSDVPATPVLNLTNLHNEVRVEPSGGKMFYRLASQK